ncbi:hypothetical protein N7478_002741 [Penicillium angulare]|uniref:uncharacterized protein n=1 Tax=Penicillium angulare TaxID=116970 RepID=UPI0025424DEC|nr:uncharacterized protein N7478_002741 [Penicillium angulare]KAJ5287055.1 hypothetical protein N7478_002741 [Penicillium angulare]
MLKPCWTCRSRTVQCDQSQTPCFKCKKAGLECHDKRPLRWVKGVAIRGKLRGHVFKGPALPEKTQALLHSATHLKILNKPSFALQDPRIYNLDQRSKYYIDYCKPMRAVDEKQYSNRICKLFILFDSGSNPFRNLLSIGLEDPTLRKSIIALAARHYANTGYSFDATNPTIDSQFADANMDALLYKKQTIEALSSSLHQSGLCRRDQTMATILLLIFLDILESGIDGWNFHLQGAKGLLILNRSLLDPISDAHSSIDPGNMVQETRRFIKDQFSLIETLGTSLYGTSNIVSEDFLCSEETHQESIVRSFLGCPKFLLRAIQFFSNQRYVLAESKGGNEFTNNKNLQNTVMMLELTEQFDCFEWASTFQQHAAPSANEVIKICLLSQAYKAATLLYGNRVLGAVKTSILNTENLIIQLLGSIEALQGDTTIFKCLIWPVFIAGLDCSSESQRNFVLNSLRMLWGLTNCVNVISASNVLKENWKQEEQFGSSVDDISDVCRLGRGMLLI